MVLIFLPAGCVVTFGKGLLRPNIVFMASMPIDRGKTNKNTIF